MLVVSFFQGGAADSRQHGIAARADRMLRNGMNRYQWSLILILVLAAAMSCIAPPYPGELWLQHSATALVVIGLPIVSRWWPLSNASLTCIVAFMLLHVLGARYIYSCVPYDEWCYGLLGWRPTERYGWTRNHYDRLVHFAFGAFWLLPFWEISTRHLHVPRRAGWIYALALVMASSLLYELFEWFLALALSPESAEAYNGQQGDMFDAQKDMALAVLGSLVAMPIGWVFGTCDKGSVRP